MFKNIRKAQSTIEYQVLLAIIVAAMVIMANYMNRGFSGRWRAAVDDLGDQYDPRYANSSVRYILLSNTATQITALNQATGGYYTFRQDTTNSVESKIGFQSVGAY